MASRILIYLIKVYQAAISPYLGTNCRFSPTCSHYACQALQKYGALRGGLIATRRILRCHPWHPGGHDPLT